MTAADSVMKFLAGTKGQLDDAIRLAASTYFRDHREDRTFTFDLNECNRESLNLRDGKDLCYDRPAIGLSYSLWYHGRRVNTFLKYFAEALLSESKHNQTIEIIDLGAGTGAVQWAAGMAYIALLKTGIRPPSLTIVNVDVSAFMLAYNRDHLWPALMSKYPDLAEIGIEYSVNSWSNTDAIAFANPWIVASYLFDHVENKEDIGSDFLRLAERFQPNKIALLTSNQAGKREFLGSVANQLASKGYRQERFLSELMFSGTMDRTHYARQALHKQSGAIFSTVPSWTDFSLFGIVLNPSTPSLKFGSSVREKMTIELYSKPITVRRDIVPSEQQLEAAKLDGRPTIIVGPAGCGKSVVLTERIRNLVDAHDYSSSLKILVTTFNKQLMGALGTWLKDLFDSRRVEMDDPENPDFYFNGFNSPSIRLMHFDILPTQLGKINGNLQFDRYHASILAEIIHEKGIDKRDSLTTDPEFLLEEYHRVRYGLMIKSWDDYLTIDRKGRKKRLIESQRLVVKSVLMAYEQRIEKLKVDSITTRRMQLLRKLDDGSIQVKFDHIFVDEFQDCTQADYRIFYQLIKDPNNLVIAGDYAQAVHIGKSADVPRDKSNVEIRMGNFKTHRLEGSYRLPYRISECIKPISARIQLHDHELANLITPYKGSPPGSRPIVVYATSTEGMAAKIVEVVNAYAAFDIVSIEKFRSHCITILEKDEELASSLNSFQTGLAETDTILKLKGLEKRCILWSTRIDVNHQDEVNSYVYTILTRTSGILIIALFADFPIGYKPLLQELRKDRLIFWDEETKEAYDSLR